jgi:DNA-directed RNA polymerase specialized sigma24 family protein
MTRRPRANYTAGEIKAMIEEYAALRAKADTSPSGMRALLQLADIDYELARLPLEYYAAVLLHGMLGLTQRETAELLHVKPTTVNKRYRLGLEEITYWINGGQ